MAVTVAVIGRATVSLRTAGAVIMVLFGLLVTAIGSGWAASAVIIDKKTATELAATKWDLNEELRRSLIEQSRAARNGLMVVVIGSALQFAGVIWQHRAARGSPA